MGLTKYSTSYIQQIANKMKLCLILIGLLAFSVCSIQAQEEDVVVAEDLVAEEPAEIVDDDDDNDGILDDVDDDDDNDGILDVDEEDEDLEDIEVVATTELCILKQGGVAI